MLPHFVQYVTGKSRFIPRWYARPDAITVPYRTSAVGENSNLTFLGTHSSKCNFTSRWRSSSFWSYRGYFFHILTRQGKHAPGGAKNYIINVRMTEGFAFIAYPAEHRSSGVMTFVVNEDGIVYPKDLGKKTESLGKTMQEYNPDPTWRKADEEPPQTAKAQKP